MAEQALGYFVDGSGDTVQIPLAQSQQAALSGYLPASPKQIEEFEKVKKFSTTTERAKTFGEGAAQALTLGGSTWAEKALGVSPEDIRAREELNPGEHLAGTLTGVALPLVLTAGGAGAVEGGAAAAEAATEGGAGLLGAARAASSVSAPSLIAKAGEGAAHALEGVLPEATTALGRIGTKAALGAASAGTEGALYGAGHVVHEAALGDPNLTWQSAAEEVGLSGLLGGGIGAAGGALSGLTRETLGGGLGKKLEEWSNTFEGNQNIKSAAGPGKGQAALRSLYKKMSPEAASRLGQEAGEMGLVTPWTKAADTYERAQTVLDEVGPKLGDGLKAIDESGEAVAPKVSDLAEKMRKEVLAPLENNPVEKPLAHYIQGVIDDYETKLGGAEAKTTLSDLHAARQELGKAIYGLNGDLTVSTARKEALNGLKNAMSDEISAGIEKSGGDLDAWKALNRQYHVASTISRIAEKGMAGAGLSGVPLTALITGGAGLISGGPLGAAALGAGAMLAKRYGPGVLAAGARGVRRLVDEGGAESLVNKTAELISSERRAATGAEAATGAAGAGRLARAFDIAAEKLEPAVAPVKDAARDVAQEHVGHVEKNATDAPETVAALSQLEKAKQSVDKRVNALARSVVTGGAAPEGAKKFSEREDEHLPLDRIHQLANNPDLMQQQISKATAELTAHAPGVAQAAAVHMSKTVSFLNAKYPPMPKLGPLGPVLKMPKSQLLQMHKTQSVINSPSLLLKHAANHQLTPELVAAVQATAPERLAQIQQAVLQSVAEHPASVPYKSRLMIGILMGRDMDGTTTPQSIQAAQLAYALPSAKSPETQLGGGKSTQTGLGKLSLAGNMRLPGQAAESRRRADA
jgi:hypothetical protein